MKTKIATALLIIAALALPRAALADFDKGNAAYDNKDYATALSE